MNNLKPANLEPRLITIAKIVTWHGKRQTIPAELANWVRTHKLVVWLTLLLAFIGAVHAFNMLNFPYYENDEGVYVSQAWAILREGQLAPYTYWYDHAPAGWILIAGWAFLTGGFHTFGTSVASGRVLMLLLHLASAALLFGIARTLSRHVWVASLAVLLFSLPAYALYFERRVLLDNIATFWVLLSLYLLLSGRFTLSRAWGSALAFGIAALTKENMAFLFPALAALTLWRADRSHRAFAVLGWVALVSSVVSMYALMAVIKSELFPTGTLLGGTAAHVSLLGTLSYQASRGKDGGLFDWNSGFWSAVRAWSQDEPLLVIGGTISAAFSLLLIRRNPAQCLVGACALLLWAFLARGGIVLSFYLLPSIPFLAINIALALGVAVDLAANTLVRGQRPETRNLLTTVATSVIAAGCVVSLAIGYLSTEMGNAAPLRSDLTSLTTLSNNSDTAWTNKQANAQEQATQWITQHVSPNQTVVIDDAIWVDLHESHPLAHWYWKVDLDPAIRDGIFHDKWQNIDYILINADMPREAQVNQLTLVQQAMAHCTVVAHFDTGGWPLQICKIHP